MCAFPYVFTNVAASIGSPSGVPVPCASTTSTSAADTPTGASSGSSSTRSWKKGPSKRRETPRSPVSASVSAAHVARVLLPSPAGKVNAAADRPAPARRDASGAACSGATVSSAMMA